MDRRARSPRRRSSLRAGFSMIELLIVIVIIAILSGFLLQAVNGARQQARIVTVVNDIKALEKAIADFKLKFGVEPPSFIVLYEAGSAAASAPNWDADTTTMSTPALSQGARRASRAIIRELWPSFDFVGSYDIDGDSVMNEVHVLNGAECLAFFLGGLQQPTTINGINTVSSRGFSANPATPFLGYTGNRIGPFLADMDPVRFIDLDADGIFEYRDPLPGQSNPYQFFSSYNGRGYRVNGLDNVANTNDDETIRVGGQQTLRQAYQQAAGNWSTYPPSPNPLPVHFKENGFQIISPGFDGAYGYGGFLSTESGVSSPANSDPPWATTPPRPLNEERDNITNIKGGTLG